MVLLTANDGIVLHDLKVLSSQNICASSGGDKDLTLRGSLFHRNDLITRNSSLESVDGVDLSDDDTSTHPRESHSATLTDITVSSDDGDLSSDHDIGGSLYTIDKRLSATVKVVELALSDGVVDVDGRDKELALLEHAVKVVNTSGGLLGDTIAVLEEVRVLLVDKSSEVSTIIEDEVELLAILERDELLFKTPVVFLLSLTLPSEAIIFVRIRKYKR